jgi:twitching motility protein PilT
MYSAIQTGQSVGMQTMDQGLQQLVDKRLIDVAIARSKARQPDNIV